MVYIKRLMVTGLCLLSPSPLAGCYQLTIQSASEEPMVLNGPAVLKRTQYKVIRHFYREQELDYVFGSNPQQDIIVGRILAEETGPEAGAINLQIRRVFAPLDVVVSLFTLGIYSRARVVVEGDVIKWKKR